MQWGTAPPKNPKKPGTPLVQKKFLHPSPKIPLYPRAFEPTFDWRENSLNVNLIQKLT